MEDNPTDVFVISEVIATCGMKLKLHIAKNGEEALRYLQELERSEKSVGPALVLLDLNVPKVAGIEVLRQLRGGSRCSRTPVIVVTSSTAEADREAVQRLGTDGYFQKPQNLGAYMQLGRLIQDVLNPAEGNKP